MLRLVYECKACGREHQVPSDWQERKVQPSDDDPRGGEMLELDCRVKDVTSLYRQSEIRWADKGL